MQVKILNASAGSGKTYQLAYKYVRDVVEQPGIYRNILAVTFTNKATEEMKSRILKEIHLLASGAPSNYLSSPDLRQELNLDEQTIRARAKEVRSKILHDYSRFTVLTIDTFFQRILRAFIKELGIDLNYNVEIETSSVLAQSAETLIEQITTDHDLQRWLIEFVQERIDEGRRWDVRDGILSLAGEIFKEKNKEALTTAPSREELARIVTQATANAELTRERMRTRAQKAIEIIIRAGLSVNDFPYKGTGFANYFYTTANGATDGYKARVSEAKNSEEKWGKPGTPVRSLAPQLQPLLREMCDIYDLNIRHWNTAALLRENYRSFALLADLYAKVRQMCDEQNMLLLSETKYILSEFIGHNDVPFIYEKVGNRFERFMIDEFQDTSAREWANFLPLLKNAMSQSEAESVLLVGDIKQSIYRWRGGDWKILHSEAAEALGLENTKMESLRENYRSLPMVVEFNNRIVSRIVAADNMALNTLLDEATARGDMEQSECNALNNTLSDAYRDNEQTARRRSDREGYVSVETFDERPLVVERIQELLNKGFHPCDMLILVRGANDGAKVAAELLEFKRTNQEGRYRFDVMTQEALIVGNAPVSSFVTAALRLALNAEDSLHRAVYNHYLDLPFDAPLTNQARAFFRSIRLLSPEEAFERIVMRHSLQNDRRQLAYLQAVHEQIIAFCTNKIADIQLFLRWWDEHGSSRSLSVEQSQSSIEITTIHKAKGLERPVVIIPYCSWKLDPKSTGQVANIVWAEARGGAAEAVGRFPVKYRIAMAESGFSAEFYREKVYSHVDNINLLYVALTRAAESLHIFVPAHGAKGVMAGGLLLEQITVEDQTAAIGKLQGRYTSTTAGERYEFGEFTGPAPQRQAAGDVEHIVLDNYPTAQADLRLRLPSQRYFEEENEVELSPRNYGILMHKAFENATREEDIFAAVTQMHNDGTLSDGEVATLSAMLKHALEDSRVRSWFSDDWDQVRNEHEIIMPGSSAMRRPDRVMTQGTRAVVIDYKFGERDPARYRRQISEYMALLRQMGYTDCEGYLWYVKRGVIEPIEA